MTRPGGKHPSYCHGLLVHDGDEELVAGTRTFVEQGLSSGGQVLVHGTRSKVDMLRPNLPTDSRLEYGFDEEMYLEPTTTLFAYQRSLAQSPTSTPFWVTGTVPLGHDPDAEAAWARYESAVDEALGPYPFRAMCTYDVRTRPASVIVAARATHSVVGIDRTRQVSPQYVDPASFLATPQARVPAPPTTPASLTATVGHLHDLMKARSLIWSAARHSSAVTRQDVEQFLNAVHEVGANGIVHGGPPVRISLWVDVCRLTCLVEDSGSGNVDPVAGYRHPEAWRSMGLWVARQMVDDLFIGSSPSGGCGVLLTRRAS